MEDRIFGGLQHCPEMCCEKGGCHGRWACMVRRWHHHGDVVFRTGGLAYDTLTEFAYNNALSTTTSVSPFFADKRYHPNITVHPECDIASS